jgi:beta-phosphoglucomutase
MSAPGAIFDLDGTLVDTCALHERAWANLAHALGLPMSRTFFLEHFGRRNEPIIAALHERAQRDVPEAGRMHELAERKEEEFRAMLAASFPAMPGAHGLLRALRDARWRLAIGSSAPPTNVDAHLRGLGCADLFDAVVTGACVTRGKPDPDVFLLAAERLRIQPSSCVVIEDAAPGIEAAHRAKMVCVALCSEGHTHAELAAADLVIDSLNELTPVRLAALVPSAHA